MQYYMPLLAYSIAFKIDGVIFIYVNRDVLDMKSYLFTPTDEMKEELVGKITNCDDFIEQGFAPPKPTDLPRSVCEYCNYKTVCRGDG